MEQKAPLRAGLSLLGATSGAAIGEYKLFASALKPALPAAAGSRTHARSHYPAQLPRLSLGCRQGKRLEILVRHRCFTIDGELLGLD